MHQFINGTKSIDNELQALQLDLDYELATLYQALQEDNQEEITRSKARLKELCDEMEAV